MESWMIPVLPFRGSSCRVWESRRGSRLTRVQRHAVHVLALRKSSRATELRHSRIVAAAAADPDGTSGEVSEFDLRGAPAMAALPALSALPAPPAAAAAPSALSFALALLALRCLLPAMVPARSAQHVLSVQAYGTRGGALRAGRASERNT